MLLIKTFEKFFEKKNSFRDRWLAENQISGHWSQQFFLENFLKCLLVTWIKNSLSLTWKKILFLPPKQLNINLATKLANWGEGLGEGVMAKENISKFSFQVNI